MGLGGFRRPILTLTESVMARAWNCLSKKTPVAEATGVTVREIRTTRMYARKFGGYGRTDFTGEASEHSADSDWPGLASRSMPG